MSKVEIDFSTNFMENEHLPVMIDHQKITKRIYEKKKSKSIRIYGDIKKKNQRIFKKKEIIFKMTLLVF